MRDDRRDTLSTYRHLRLGMALLLALLLVAVGLRALSAPGPGICFEGSISAYYFTSARAVFVAALCALGTCLIVYRGNTDAEDVALNASGALAFVVAFVPTGAPATTGVTCSASNVPSAGQIEEAVTNNVVALLLVGAVGLVVAGVLAVRAARAAGGPPGTGRGPLRALGGSAATLAVAAGAYAAWPAGFRAHAHSVAAVATFVGILVVVGLNAFGANRACTAGTEPTRYRNAYVAVAAAMVSTGVVIGGAHLLVSGWRHGVLLIEATLLVEFLLFWLVQTAELWDSTRRAQPDGA